MITHIAQHYKVSLAQVREGSRLIAGRAAKSDSNSLTAESSVMWGDFKAAAGWPLGCSAALASSTSNIIFYINKTNTIVLTIWDLLLVCMHADNSFLKCAR